MKAITANRLHDGVVVYLGSDDQWTESLSDARLYEDEQADGALAAMSTRMREVAVVWLIDVSPDHLATGREALRETIRSEGPTVPMGHVNE